MKGHCLKIDCPGLNPALLLTVSQFISEVGISNNTYLFKLLGGFNEPILLKHLEHSIVLGVW